MEYIKSIGIAIKMIIDGELTTGCLMSAGGSLLFVMGIVMLCISIHRNKKQREQLLIKLKNMHMKE